MTACHYTPSQIDDLEMIDVIELFKYWKEWPPTHEILAIVHRNPDAVKAEQREQKIVDPEDPSGIGALISAFPKGAISTLNV
jgi:hypothetical protein